MKAFERVKELVIHERMDQDESNDADTMHRIGVSGLVPGCHGDMEFVGLQSFLFDSH